MRPKGKSKQPHKKKNKPAETSPQSDKKSAWKSFWDRYSNE